MLRFFHISDSHIDAYERNSTSVENVKSGRVIRAKNTELGLTKVIDAINSMAGDGLAADFIVHTGDICNSDDRQNDHGRSFELATTLIDTCGLNTIYVNGNHDQLAYIRKSRQWKENQIFDGLGGITQLSPDITGSFYADYSNYTILVLDARPRLPEPFADGCHPMDPSGMLLPSEIEKVGQLLNEVTNKVVVFMHYPPIELDSPWVDRSMLVENGSDLHKMFNKHPEKICGVFFGHVHHSQQAVIDKVLYVAVGATGVQFDTSSHLNEHAFSAEKFHTFNYVLIDQNRVLVKQYNLNNHQSIPESNNMRSL